MKRKSTSAQAHHVIMAANARTQQTVLSVTVYQDLSALYVKLMLMTACLVLVKMGLVDCLQI